MTVRINYMVGLIRHVAAWFSRRDRRIARMHQDSANRHLQRADDRDEWADGL